jgi:hypothetical protein
MRTLISAVTLLALLGFYSCDKVKNPTVVTSTAVGTKFDTVRNSAVAGFKKTLLEDYTGHKCGNCPKAARDASSLTAQYQSSLVVIAVHAGYFAKTDLIFPDSYTCAVGNAWDGGSPGFNVSNTGNPNGMVNRKAYPGFTLVHKDTWPTTVAMAMNDPMVVKMEIETRYDTTARALNVDTKLTFLQAYPNKVMLQLVLTEDGIVGPQLDYSLTPNDHVDEYDFEHMLRTDVNGTWGEDAMAGPINANATTTLKKENFAVNSKFRHNHLYLVAFVYDAVTKEVLQVEKLKIKK